jgi:hypothetical protein
MEILSSVLSWGSPLGIALFFFFSCSGVGILFWGLSHFINSNKDEDKDSIEPE